MAIKVYQYPRCSTCKKALQWLKDHGIEAEVFDITTETPDADQLKAFWTQSGLPLKRFFNTSGMKYREMGLSERLKTMSDEEQLACLASDGMLIKRPMLVADDGVLLGFREKAWTEFFG